MKQIISSPYLTNIFRIVVGLVFIYASIDKIADPAYFAVTIQHYQLLPNLTINLVAIILPWLELICGVLLVAGIWHRSAALIISFLLITFIIAITSVIIRGLDIDCGCFGSDTSANWARIVEDLFMLTFSVQIIVYPRSRLAIENIWEKS
jgi:putative oxidoreductase